MLLEYFSFVYRWWDNNNALEFSDTPILLSLTTVRHFYPNIKIYVLDHSHVKHDWRRWIDFFNLEVIKVDSVCVTWPFKSNVLNMLCAKPFDLCEFHKHCKTDNVVYLDGDVFMIHRMRPRFKSVVSCTSNTGVLVYNKRRAYNFFDLWKTKTKEVLRNPVLQQELLTDFPNPMGLIEDELIYRHLNKSHKQHLLSNSNNFFVCWDNGRLTAKFTPENPLIPEDIFNIHIRSMSMSKSKIAFMIKEINEIICKYKEISDVKNICVPQSIFDLIKFDYKVF